jgi:hypothetical protein
VVDKHLVLGVSVITSVHDEARKMTNAVDPEWVSVEVARGSLKLDESGSFMLIAVKDDLPDRLVVLIIVNQRSEEFVDHSSLHPVSLARDRTLLQVLNASLDEVRTALPLSLVVAGLKEFHRAAGVVEDLLAFWGHRPHLNTGALVGPVCGG